MWNVDHDSKVAIATLLELVWNMRNDSYDKKTNLYTKTWQDCVEAVVPDEDMWLLISVLAYWPADCEEFVNTYAAVKRIDA